MVLNFAHRGSLTEAPENTLSAIQKAIDKNAQAIEIDVQLSKDGHLVVIHDHRFSRLNPNVPGLVKDYTLKEIKQIDVGSSFSEEFAGETLATLDEVLEICPKDTLLNIEIKNIPIIYNNIEENVLQCLTRHNRKEQIVISSFDHEALAKVQALDSNMPLGLLLYYRLVKPWEYVKNSGLNVWSVHPNMVYTTEQLVQEIHRLGLKVYPYTVNHIDKYEEMLEYGVDGVFSNNPEIFRK